MNNNRIFPFFCVLYIAFAPLPPGLIIFCNSLNCFIGVNIPYYDYFMDLQEDTFTSINTSIYKFYNTTTLDAMYLLSVPGLNRGLLIEKDPNSMNILSNCNGKSLLGGYEIFGDSNFSLIEVKVPLSGKLPSYWDVLIFMDVYSLSEGGTNGIKTMREFPYFSSMSQIYIQDFGPLQCVYDKQTSRIMRKAIFMYTNLDFFIYSVHLATNPTFAYYGFRNITVTLLLCDPTCLNCSTQTNCRVCVENARLSTGGKCICPDGYYWSSCPNASIPCNYLCNKCADTCTLCNETHCLSCAENYYLTLQGSCLDTCPTGSYAEGMICKACDSSCYKCWGPLNSNCIECPLNSVFYKNSCFETCPKSTFNYSSKFNISQTICDDCDISCKECKGAYSTECTQCADSNKYLDDGLCLIKCPNDKFQYETNKICLVCDSKCKTCFGINEDECLSCMKSEDFLDESQCVSLCPANKFPSANNLCESCGPNCVFCLGVKECGQCLEGYYLQEETFICQKIKDLYIVVQNVFKPFVFLIKFSQPWSYIDDQIKDIFKFQLINNTKNIGLTPKIIEPSPYENLSFCSYYLSLSYNKSFDIDDFISLRVNVSINYSKTNHEYRLINNSSDFLIPLGNFVYQDDKNFIFNSTSNSYIQKRKIKPTLSNTGNSIILKLDFDFIDLNLNLFVERFSTLKIDGFLTTDFDYEINGTDYVNSYTITIKPFKSIVLGPIATYSLQIPESYILINSFSVNEATTTIKMNNYYLNSSYGEIEKVLKDQKQTVSSMATSSAAAGTLLSSGNPLFLQGLMLSQLILMLKFNDINYPPVVDELFKETPLPKMIFFYEFEANEQDLKVMPQHYIDESVSPYFLNNYGENIGQNAVLFIIGIILLVITAKITRINFIMKMLRMIRSILVWEPIIFWYFEALLRFFFFIFVSLLYPAIYSKNGIFNYCTAIIFLVFGVGFLIHIRLTISVCSRLKLNEFSHKLSIFMKDSPTMIRNSNFSISRKTRIFDENTMKSLKFTKTSVILHDPNIESSKNVDFNSSVFPNKNKNSFNKIQSKEIKEFDKNYNILMSPITPNSPPSLNSPPPLTSPPNLLDFEKKSKVSFVPQANFFEKIPKSKESGESSGDSPENKEIISNNNTNLPSPLRFRKTHEFFESEVSSPVGKIIIKRNSDENKEKIPQKKSLISNFFNYKIFKMLYSPKNQDQYLKDYAFLHEEIKNTNYRKYFVFIDVVRQIIIVIAFATLRFKPLIQMIFINVFNMSFIFTMMILQPFKQKLSFFISLVNELITETAFVGVLSLAILDALEDEDIEIRTKCGVIIIIANLCLLYWIIFTSLLGIFLKIFQKIRSKNKVFVENE